MAVILASASPRRLELLRQMGMEPVVMPSSFNEVENNLPPAELVRVNALGKGEEILRKVAREDLVISADTVVVLQGRILGKPHDAEEAKLMLRSLSGQTHEVLTGLAVFYQGRREVAVERSEVRFRNLTEEEIANYVAGGEPLDKAGAYGIQGRGAVLVEEIRGCYYNIVGLPLTRFYKILAELDVIDYDKLLHQGITF